jgi:hypothetical protein
MNRKNNLSNTEKPVGNKSITNKIANVTSNVTEKGKELTEGIREKVSNLTEKVKNTFKETTDQVPLGNIQQGLKSFEESNTAISKFVFIVLLLFLFVFFFNLGVWLIQTWMGSNKQPLLLDGMVSANKTTKISVNPNVKNSVPIYRSINENQGLEFTWNIWFYVDSLNANNPTYSRIFSKGSENQALQLNTPTGCPNGDATCKNVFNSSPGLFITQNRQHDSVFPNTNQPTILSNHINLILLLNTFQSSQSNEEYAESITIENVPIQKWVCATIRVQQTTVDIYINGVLTQRKKLNNLPIQNYYDVLVGDNNNGFNGSISSLRYFNKAIGYDEVQTLFGKGPNLNTLEKSGIMPNGVDYISMNWYYK